MLIVGKLWESYGKVLDIATANACLVTVVFGLHVKIYCKPKDYNNRYKSNWKKNLLKLNNAIYMYKLEGNC